MEQKTEVEIRFIRLDDDVCVALNHMSKEMSRRVSDIANDALREWLRRSEPAEDSTAAH